MAESHGAPELQKPSCAPSVIALATVPVRLGGWAYGLPQTPLVGMVEIRLPRAFDRAAWDRRWRHMLGSEVTALIAAGDEPPPDLSAAGRLAHELLAALQALLRVQRIPVYPAVVLFRAGPLPRSPHEPERWRYAACSIHETVSSAALRWLIDVANDACAGEGSLSGASAVTELSAGASQALADRGRTLFDRLKPFAASGLNLFPLLDAALELGIEVRRLSGRVLNLGTGASGRLFDSTLTDRTPSIGVQIARSKRMCNEVLRAAGLPVPPQHIVGSLEQALKAAQLLGFPVVVKPSDRDRGEGVAADLRGSNAVRLAYAAAAAYSREIIVERHVTGSTHRLTVWDGRLVRVTRRITAGVTGDGLSTIEQLIDRLRDDPVQRRRAARMGKVLIELDEEAQSMLGQQGLTARSVPAPGQRVRLRRRDNVNAGGTNEQIPLDQVHPDNMALALRAARLLRLDIAGIDYITEDISRSWMVCGGGICEVNAQPQIGISDTPDLYIHLLREAMPGLGRIPIELHVHHETVPFDLSDRLPQGPHNAQAHARAVEIDGTAVVVRPPSAFEAIRQALVDPAVHGLLAAMPLAELQAQGLPARWVDRMVVHLPDDWTESQRQGLLSALHELADGHIGGLVLGAP